MALAFVVLHLIIFTEESFLNCVPFEASFNASRPNPSSGQTRRCVNVGKVAAVRNILSVAQDFIILILPATLFWNLDVPRPQKMALTGLLAFGFVVCVVGLVRLGFFWDLYFKAWDWSCKRNIRPH